METRYHLGKNAYPLGNISNWLTGDLDAHKVLMGRLAKLAEDNSKKINILYGYRSLIEQRALVHRIFKTNKHKGYYLGKKGSVYNAKGQIVVAAPGRSRHQYGLAVDVNTDWVMALDNSILKKYGLHKPLSYESWHIEPIETQGPL
ncbi:MAG: M15 family metallopeptidase [Bacillota bacterium]|nr:M15 family metallopeptidase [Bacillota bacterium]